MIDIGIPAAIGLGMENLARCIALVAGYGAHLEASGWTDTEAARHVYCDHYLHLVAEFWGL